MSEADRIAREIRERHAARTGERLGGSEERTLALPADLVVEHGLGMKNDVLALANMHNAWAAGIGVDTPAAAALVAYHMSCGSVMTQEAEARTLHAAAAIAGTPLHIGEDAPPTRSALGSSGADSRTRTSFPDRTNPFKRVRVVPRILREHPYFQAMVVVAGMLPNVKALELLRLGNKMATHLAEGTADTAALDQLMEYTRQLNAFVADIEEQDQIGEELNDSASIAAFLRAQVDRFDAASPSDTTRGTTLHPVYELGRAFDELNTFSGGTLPEALAGRAQILRETVSELARVTGGAVAATEVARVYGTFSGPGEEEAALVGYIKGQIEANGEQFLRGYNRYDPARPAPSVRYANVPPPESFDIGEVAAFITALSDLYGNDEEQIPAVDEDNDGEDDSIDLDGTMTADDGTLARLVKKYRDLRDQMRGPATSEARSSVEKAIAMRYQSSRQAYSRAGFALPAPDGEKPVLGLEPFPHVQAAKAFLLDRAVKTEKMGLELARIAGDMAGLSPARNLGAQRAAAAQVITDPEDVIEWDADAPVPRVEKVMSAERAAMSKLRVAARFVPQVLQRLDSVDAMYRAKPAVRDAFAELVGTVLYTGAGGLRDPTTGYHPAAEHARAPEDVAQAAVQAVGIIAQA